MARGRELRHFKPLRLRAEGPAGVADGRYKAAVVEVDCGATTSYANWAVLALAGEPFDYEKDRLAAVETQAMRIEWQGQKVIVCWRAGLRPNLSKAQPDFVEYRPL